MSRAQSGYAGSGARSLVVELVGPAGAGKTTLSQGLSRSSEWILVGTPPYVRSIKDTPFFVGNCLMLMPMLLRLRRSNCRRLTRREIAWMATLNGWPAVLKRTLKRQSEVMLLDQGPVFLAAQLHVLGPASLSSELTETWWTGVYGRWSAILDLVVCLDTSDAILLERIRTRPKWHLMKDRPEPEVFEFLAHYRLTYERMISMLTADSSGPRVLRFDTARESPDTITNRLLNEFGLAGDRSQAEYYTPASPAYSHPRG